MPTWNESGALKVIRAKKHLEDLHSHFAAFEKRKPYEAYRDQAANGDLVVRLRIGEQPPAEWGVIAGELIHNLRSALNILWSCVWPTTTATGRNPDFPILATQRAFENTCASNSVGRLKPLYDALRPVKPYKGGNDALWALQSANNADKHELLLGVYGNTGDVILGFSWERLIRSLKVPNEEALIKRAAEAAKTQGGNLHLRAADPLPATDGVEIFRVLKDARSGNDDEDVGLHKYVVNIVFADTAELKGQDMLQTLAAMVTAVDECVAAFTAAGLLK